MLNYSVNSPISNYVTYGTDRWYHTLACQSGRTLACISVSTSGCYVELLPPVLSAGSTLMSTSRSGCLEGISDIVILLYLPV